MNDKIKENLLDQSCAPTDNLQSNWDRIDWTKAEQAVKKLQARIVKAQKEGRHNKVKALQWTLTHSFYAKALAVKRVTSNGGGCTPGVDKEIWDTPKAKMQAITQLKRRGYQPMPLRRVHIKKSNGKLRPLGIPTMKDRAMQALYLMALEPVSETTADTRSYGFRKERCCMDAIQQCHNILRKGYSPEWILEGDIKGCFDHISHEWLLANIPMDKAILRKWLKCGYVFNKQMFPTEEGTPQGGIISPTLANMTLDGLQKALADRYKRHHVNGKLYSPMVNLVRYADDFIITCENKETLENEIKPLVAEFMSDRGLTLSEEKTVITNVHDGFDFLGFNIRKYGKDILTKPTKKSEKRFMENIPHIPTGIVTQCQNDRSQHKNKDQAMKQMKAKLYELEMQKKNAEKQAMEDNKSDIGWGSQIRSYVLDDSRIKDLRTGVETRNTQAVLDGSLDQFIEASLKAGL